ncbi:MAG TPA: hypothetical protein VHX38_11965 [Pseudonocardiaceae bacterium]|nr:hypothetical protein [Pseudonocardiaceae bacterium]
MTAKKTATPVPEQGIDNSFATWLDNTVAEAQKTFDGLQAELRTSAAAVTLVPGVDHGTAEVTQPSIPR